MRKKVFLVYFVLVSMLSGCSHPQEVKIESKKEKKLLVGFSMATLKEDRWLRDREIFFAKAKQANFDVIVSNANNSAEKQYAQVAEMIQSGIDILVIVPHDSDKATDAVNLAKKAKIPVISYDRLCKNADVDAYVSFNNKKVGELQGEAILKAVPNGNLILLNGSEDDNNSKMFNEGLMSKLKPYIDNSKIKIVSETWVEDWRRETAYSFVSESLMVNKNKIDGIIAANDSLAWGAIDALSEVQMSGGIPVVGHDADLAACQRIIEGTQLLTVYKPIKNLVQETINTCIKLSQGEKVSSEDIINDGTFNIPYIMIDIAPVTKENMDDTVIKDGFQLKEDVYRKNK